MSAPIAVITPLHKEGRAYVEEAYRSLVKQTHGKWTWIVLENHGGHLPDAIRSDKRVKVVRDKAGLEGIGALKRAACAAAKPAPYVVELDCDDLLTPTALERIAATFEKEKADFVYSDFAEFEDKGDKWVPSVFNPAFGWESYEILVAGRPKGNLRAMRAPEATYHNVRLVDWAPNHVRAWRSKAYWAVGGHDASLSVADDHDLIVRMVLAGKKFVRIPECLYLYRIHGQNTVATRNAEIRQGTEAVYNKTIWPLAEAFADRPRDDGHGLLKVDLCGGIDGYKDYLTLDLEGAAVTCDLNERWPLEDSSVGVLRAHDAIEHLRDPIHTMSEAFRVLAPGGFFMILVPSTNGEGAFCDPTHRSFWNKRSFRYYTEASMARYIRFQGRFQVSRVLEWCPNGEKDLPYVEAHLFCVKDGFRAMGAWNW